MSKIEFLQSHINVFLIFCLTRQVILKIISGFSGSSGSNPDFRIIGGRHLHHFFAPNQIRSPKISRPLFGWGV